MGEGSIEICSLVGHLSAGFVVLTIFNLPHDIHTVSNHYQDYTHIFRKREQQIAKVFRFDSRAFGIKFIYAYQSTDNAGHIFTESSLHLFGSTSSVSHTFVQHNTQNRRPLHSDFFGNDNGSLHILNQWI